MRRGHIQVAGELDNYTARPNPFPDDFIRCYGMRYDWEAQHHRESSPALQSGDVQEFISVPIIRAC